MPPHGRERERVARRAVVEQAVAAADNRLGGAEDVVGEPEARAKVNAPVVDAPAQVPFGRVAHSVERVTRTGDDPSDQVGRQVHGRTCGIVRPGVAPRSAGQIEFHGFARVPERRVEVRRLQPRVVLRLDDVEPHPVVERQLLRELPVVLQEPLEVRVPVLALEDALVRLRQAVEVAEQRVRVWVTGVVRVVHVVAEDDRHRVAGGLVLAAPLDEDARLQHVLPLHLRDVVDEVERRVRVLVRELGVVLGVVCPDASEGLVRCVGEADVDELGRVVRVGRLECQSDARHRSRVAVDRVERQVVLAGSEDELVDQRRRNVRGDVQRRVARRPLLEDGRREREVLARGPADSVRQDLDVEVLAGRDVDHEIEAGAGGAVIFLRDLRLALGIDLYVRPERRR